MVPLNSTAAVALLIGVLLGVGAWLVLSAIPRIGRPRLAERVAPYVADFSDEARELLARRPADPAPVFGVVLGPMTRRARDVATNWIGGADVIAHRLRQAGASSGVERFRAEQLAWGATAFAVATGLAIWAPGFAMMPAPVRVATPLLAAVGGALAREWMLQRRVNQRLARITDELPTVLELLTLSLTAGESMLDAIRRVARTGSGELSREFAGIVAAVGTGVPLAVAIRALRDDLDHAALSRALDQVLGALDRGAPLASVLASQAGDAREQAKRTIIELAGRKEIAMLVPLVFLILPITIAFALLPGYLVLQTDF